MKIITDLVNFLLGVETEPVTIKEQHDPLNRLVKLFKIGDKHYVSVDGTGIECGSLKKAELEYDFRIQNSNRLI